MGKTRKARRKNSLAKTLGAIKIKLLERAHESESSYKGDWFTGNYTKDIDALVKMTMEDLEEKPAIRKIRFRREQ